MVTIRRKEEQKAQGSPRAEVGEIDTRAPFQSVKAAVSLFGEVAVSKVKRADSMRKRLSSENVLDKETQLHLAQRELNRIKKQLESAETTKAQALSELEKAKRTLDDLNTKLKAVCESKQSAIKGAEYVKNQAKQLERAKSQKEIGTGAWKRELEHARKEYATTVAELDAVKQELTKIRQDFDAALETKQIAFQTAAEAQRSANVNKEKATELSKEIVAMKASREQLRLALIQAQEEQAKIIAEKDACRQSYIAEKEEAEKKLMPLKEECDPEITRNLEVKLAETSVQIETLQEEMKKVHASEMDTVRLVTSELNEATRKLQEVAEEENFLRNLVISLRLELENVRKDQDDSKEKKAATESLPAYLHYKFQRIKSETVLEPALAEEKEDDLSDEHSFTLQRLISESENARKEADEMNKNTEELKQETEANQIAAEETEKRLQLVLREAEEASAAEQKVINEMKVLSETQDCSPGSTSQSSSKINSSFKKFEAFRRKVKESEDLIEKTEATIMAEVEAINTRKIEADRKIEDNLKVIEEIEIAMKIALKNAEMAESAKLMVQGELSRWRQKEQKVAAEALSQSLEDLDKSS